MIKKENNKGLIISYVILFVAMVMFYIIGLTNNDLKVDNYVQTSTALLIIFSILFGGGICLAIKNNKSAGVVGIIFACFSFLIYTLMSLLFSGILFLYSLKYLLNYKYLVENKEDYDLLNAEKRSNNYKSVLFVFSIILLVIGIIALIFSLCYMISTSNTSLDIKSSYGIITALFALFNFWIALLFIVSIIQTILMTISLICLKKKEFVAGNLLFCFGLFFPPYGTVLSIIAFGYLKNLELVNYKKKNNISSEETINNK